MTDYEEGDYHRDVDGLHEDVSVLENRLLFARYYVHKLVAHKYATLFAGHHMTDAQAVEAYTEAMRNYDGVIECADSGNSDEATRADMARGADLIQDMLGKVRANG